MSKKRSRWDIAPDEEDDENNQPPNKRVKLESENDEDKTPLMEEDEEEDLMDDDKIYIEGLGNITMQEYDDLKYQQEMMERNGPLSDDDLNEMFPAEGFKILEPPEGYESKKKLKNQTSTKSVLNYYTIPQDVPKDQFGIPIQELEESTLPQLKPDDLKYFKKLLNKVDEEKISKEEKKEREVMKLLLKIKNGSPITRKHALKVITKQAKHFGPKILFGQILPLMLSPTLEEEERHFLVKLIDRIIYQLDDEIRPYTHKILAVIEPLLIEEDYYARIEGREIISNLAKAAGLPTMISVMRFDISSTDEYVRNTTARTFAVVASALGIHSILPFLDAVCKSKKSWEARHTGIKIFQQIAILMGNGILPYLTRMVTIIQKGLEDEEMKVRAMTAHALAAMGEAANPFGIESFDPILRQVFFGVSTTKGRTLAAYLRAIGSLIPLMTDELAANYTKNIMNVIVREFYTHDENMKRIVLKVLEQCISTKSIAPKFIKEHILNDFFECFWKPSVALNRRNYLRVIQTTVALAKAVNTQPIFSRLAMFLKNQSEPFRRMTLEAIQRIMEELGTNDIDPNLEKIMIDGTLFAFQQIFNDDFGSQMKAVGNILKLFGKRLKPYLASIGGTIKHRLTHKAPSVRMQAAELIAYLAPAMKACGEEKMLSHFATVLFENLGEEYPDVLGSILGGLKEIVKVTGMERMNPSIKELLPRLSPILKSRHEMVQKHTIETIGLIADKGADLVPAKEWMRICFDLLEMLKAQRKDVRMSAIRSFGFIARAIGPQEVISTLLANLRVQERKLRVCTTIAIAIVGETCGPFTILPSLMNEYKCPDLNVQNGVLKALSFLFEYLGESGKDYVYSITPLLENALTDRDPVHRQISCTVVKHLAIGVFGKGYEDALTHLLNLVWPNILESSAHFINAVIEAIDGLRVSLGVPTILLYTIAGLFHPSRKVRNIYWKIYNSCYIYNSDAMVPFLPRIKDTPENDYNRDELDLFI